MKFDRLKNPAACAAKGETPYAINGVAIVEHRGKTFVAATDGRILSMVACQMEESDSRAGVWPVAAITAARKAMAHKPDATVTLNGVARVEKGDSAEEWKPLEQRFPDVLGVILPKGRHSVTLNAEYLATLQKALGCSALRIEMQADADGDVDDTMPVYLQPVYLDGGTDDGSFGVLMTIAQG